MGTYRRRGACGHLDYLYWIRAPQRPREKISSQSAELEYDAKALFDNEVQDIYLTFLYLETIYLEAFAVLNTYNIHSYYFAMMYISGLIKITKENIRFKLIPLSK